jgi:uncharacterized protein YcnI
VKPDRRLLRFAVLVLTGVMLVRPAAAWAHAEFTGDSSVPPDSDQALVLDVPEEKGPEVHNSKVTVEVPGGFTVSGCDEKPEWSCATSAAGRKTVVTWTRSSGSDPDTHFSFAVHTPKKGGDYPFEVNQSYTDGSTVHWDGLPDSETPAPVLQVG